MNMNKVREGRSQFCRACRRSGVTLLLASCLCWCSAGTLAQQEDTLTGAATTITEDDDFPRALNEMLPAWRRALVHLDRNSEVEPLAPVTPKDLVGVNTILGRLIRADVLPVGGANALTFTRIREGGDAAHTAAEAFHVELTANGAPAALNFWTDSVLTLHLVIPDNERIMGNPFANENKEAVLVALQRCVEAPFKTVDEVLMYGIERDIGGVSVYSGVVQYMLGPPSVRMSRPPEDYWFHNVGVLVVNGPMQSIVFKFEIPFGSDDDSDIANRPSFKRALSQKRLPMPRTLFYFGDAVSRKDLVDHEAIAEAGKQALRDHWAVMIAGPALPASEEAVEWRAYQPPGVAVPKRTGDTTEWVTSERVPTVMARWSAGDLQLMMAGRCVTIRLTGDRRVPFRDRPANLDPDVREWHEWLFLDRQALHGVLTSVLAVPFASMEEYSVRGHLKEAGGVRIFEGRIKSLKQSEKTAQGEPHWYDQLRLFVTDSDPQYFCVQIALEEDDKVAEPEP